MRTHIPSSFSSPPLSLSLSLSRSTIFLYVPVRTRIATWLAARAFGFAGPSHLVFRPRLHARRHPVSSCRVLPILHALASAPTLPPPPPPPPPPPRPLTREQSTILVNLPLVSHRLSRRTNLSNAYTYVIRPPLPSLLDSSDPTSRPTCPTTRPLFRPCCATPAPPPATTTPPYSQKSPMAPPSRTGRSIPRARGNVPRMFWSPSTNRPRRRDRANCG